MLSRCSRRCNTVGVASLLALHVSRRRISLGVVACLSASSHVSRRRRMSLPAAQLSPPRDGHLFISKTTKRNTNLQSISVWTNTQKIQVVKSLAFRHNNNFKTCNRHCRCAHTHKNICSHYQINNNFISNK